jgi:type IV pilus assembly protein PilV
MKTINFKRNGVTGFSMMEVLVALLVLSVGLLGMAALQVVSLKANHGAYQRSQATFLAYDMIDRMRANRAKAMAGDYDLTMGASSPTGTTLAILDVKDWLDNNVAVFLPSGDGSIACTAAVCTVDVQWDTRRQGGTAVDSNETTQQFSFTAEI